RRGLGEDRRGRAQALPGRADTRARPQPRAPVPAARPRGEAHLARNLPGKPGDGARRVAVAGLRRRGVRSRPVPVPPARRAPDRCAVRRAARRSAAHTDDQGGRRAAPEPVRGGPRADALGISSAGPGLRPGRLVRRALCLGVVAIALAFAGQARAGGKYAKGLLWRVSSPGVAPSHVFGTIHLADPRVLDIPDPVVRALDRSKRYYAESVQGEREATRL